MHRCKIEKTETDQAIFMDGRSFLASQVNQMYKANKEDWEIRVHLPHTVLIFHFETEGAANNFVHKVLDAKEKN